GRNRSGRPRHRPRRGRPPPPAGGARQARAARHGSGPAAPWRPSKARKHGRSQPATRAHVVVPVAGSDARQGQVSRPAETREPAAIAAAKAVASPGTAELVRRNHIGTISLLCAVAGMAGSWLAL